jgi:hypothetical protein
MPQTGNGAGDIAGDSEDLVRGVGHPLSGPHLACTARADFCPIPA